MATKKLFMVGGILVLSLAGGGVVFAFGLHRGSGGSDGKTLIGDDFGRVRLQALDMFPRGSPISAAASGLTALGFKCTPARHLLANINAPSVECDSAGRGYPTASRMQVTVMARNGMVSDIAVGNGFDPIQADARTPRPNPGGRLAEVEP